MNKLKKLTIALLLFLTTFSAAGCKKANQPATTPVSELPDASGYASFKDEASGKYGFKNGDEVVINAEFDRVAEFKDNFSVVWKNKRAGYINSVGEVICDFQFVEAGNFSNERAVVRKNDSDKYGFIGTDGKIAIDFIFDNVTSFTDNGIANVILDGKEIWIDKSGNEVNPEDYQDENIEDNEKGAGDNAENNEAGSEASPSEAPGSTEAPKETAE